MWKGDRGKSMLAVEVPKSGPRDWTWVKRQIYEADIKLQRYIDMDEPRSEDGSCFAATLMNLSIAKNNHNEDDQFLDED